MANQNSDTSLLDALADWSLEELETELEDVQTRKRSLQTHEGLLQSIIRWKRQLAEVQNGSAPSAPRVVTVNPPAPPVKVEVVQSTPRRWGKSTGRVSTRQAILAVMSERGPHVWTKDEIFDALAANDWLPQGSSPRGQMTSRLGEMVQKGELSRHGEGRYSLNVATRTEESG